MKIKEIAASIYPWDIADEGIESSVDRLIELSGINSVYLIGVMHHEKRPLTSLFYTHNPKRKYFIPEDSRVHYKLNMDSFNNTPLKPSFCQTEFLKDIDWLNVLSDYGRKKGLKVGVELSHTIYEAKLALENHPDTIQCGVDGEIFTRPFERLLCPNNPAVKEYILAMFRDTVKNHDIDYIQTCLLFFNGGSRVKAPWFYNQWMDVDDKTNYLQDLLGVARGGCFCPECRKKAKAMGYDWQRIVHDLKHLKSVADATAFEYQEQMIENHLTLGSNLTESGLLMEYPGLYAFLKFRMESVTQLVRDVYETVHEVKPDIEFRYNNCAQLPELTGLSLSEIAPYVDSVRDSDYTEQLQKPYDNFLHKRNTILKVRRGIGCQKDVIAAIAVRPNATPELIKQSIKILSTLGIDGLSLGHYDCAHLEHLVAVKQGMEEAGISLES